MPYIPKIHEQYDLLPLCRKDGGEVFDYPSKLIYETEELLGSSEGLASAARVGSSQYIRTLYKE